MSQSDLLTERMHSSRPTIANPVGADSKARRSWSSLSCRPVSSDKPLIQGTFRSVFIRRPISIRPATGGVRENGSDTWAPAAPMSSRRHRLYDRVEPRRAPDRLEIGIVGHRLLVAEPVSYRALEVCESVLALVHQSVHAGDVVEYQRIVGLDRERLRRELERPWNVAQLHQRRGAEVVRARVIRV